MLTRPGVGVSGSRRASEKGVAAARECVRQIARAGNVIVSGDAAGVDREAHAVALAEGGATIAVLPFGLSHFRVRRELRGVWDWQRALVVSEFPDNAGWSTWRAMRRNRTIIALSRALLVAEAGETGGTLAAGKEALQSGAPLFVVQYDDFSAAPGNAMLLQGGGSPVGRRRETGAPNLERLLSVVALGGRPLAGQGGLV